MATNRLTTAQRQELGRRTQDAEGLPAQFWDRVNKQGPLWNGTPCWEWLGWKSTQGYGQFYWQGRYVGAHQRAYAALVGPVPPGLELDHLCRNRACVNPAHLQPVTHAENTRRGEIRKPAKQTWPACALCGDPDGRVDPYGRRVTPWRASGARFGLDGQLCYRCYSRLRSRLARAQGWWRKEDGA